MPDPIAPVIPAAADPTAGAPAVAVAAVAPVTDATSKADAAAPAAPAATESTPSLLASADAAKRDGAPVELKAADTPSPDGATAKPETTEGKAPEARPEDGKDKPKDGTDAAAKEAPAETPPALPVYEAPKLPEGQKLDEKLLGAFDKKVGEFELAHKVDHAAMQAFRQEVINDYIAEVGRIGEQVSQHQRDVWNRLNETRINELKADPQLGGNRIETTLGNAKYALETFGGLTKPETQELLAIMDNGGVSNSRLMVKFLHNLYERFREPEPVTPNNPAASKLMSEPGQRRWYDVVDVPQSA